MAKPLGLHKPPRLRFWQQRVMIPIDLRPAYGGKSRITKSLGTEDKAEARRFGALFVAQCEQEFADKRRLLSPQLLEVVTPELSQTLAARIRAGVLQGDDALRLGSAVPVLRELTQRVAPRFGLAALQINQPLPLPPIDPLDGLSHDDAQTLASLNTFTEKQAALDLAVGNLRSVLPLVVVV